MNEEEQLIQGNRAEGFECKLLHVDNDCYNLLLC